jgi:hypothetical protein
MAGALLGAVSTTALYVCPGTARTSACAQQPPWPVPSESSLTHVLLQEWQCSQWRFACIVLVCVFGFCSCSIPAAVVCGNCVRDAYGPECACRSCSASTERWCAAGLLAVVCVAGFWLLCVWQEGSRSVTNVHGRPSFQQRQQHPKMVGMCPCMARQLCLLECTEYACFKALH